LEQKKAQLQSGNHARDGEVRFAAGVALQMHAYFMNSGRRGEVKLACCGEIQGKTLKRKSEVRLGGSTAIGRINWLLKRVLCKRESSRKMADSYISRADALALDITMQGTCMGLHIHACTYAMLVYA
jgi:hypothetical protein